jgi:hypothetical protein
MTPLRLDPADPLASVLAWLAALARALGIDPRMVLGPLSRPAAAIVRGWLADWSRQLRGIIYAKALRLAATLSPGRRAPARPRRSASERAARAGRLVAVGSSPRRVRNLHGARRQPGRPASDAVLCEAEEAALRRRVRAVFAALENPRAAALRLARRLAHRRARALAGAASWRSARVPRPPRRLGAGLRGIAPAPEPRPPNLPVSVLS